MAKVLSSISGNLISAASAGYAPTNGTDVSAIASAYQVVSATAGRSYGGSTFITSINNTYISSFYSHSADSASRAWSASYDSTGRMISALPNSAAVSAIASSYAASAASSKQDSSAMSAYALSADVSGCIDTVSANSATWGTQVVSSLSSAPAYSENWVTSINDMKLSAERANSAQWGRSAIFDNKGRYLSSLAASADVSGCIDTVSSNSASWAQVVTSLSGNANFYNQINSKSISSTVSYKARLDENGNSISALYNTVSAQSANWGGSALALSAGPGVRLYKTGDTLVAGLDETVLWTGSASMSSNSSIVLSEPAWNFECIDVYARAHTSNKVLSVERLYMSELSGASGYGSLTIIGHAGGGGIRFNNTQININDSGNVKWSESKMYSILTTEVQTAVTNAVFTKIVGVHRAASN